MAGGVLSTQQLQDALFAHFHNAGVASHLKTHLRTIVLTELQRKGAGVNTIAPATGRSLLSRAVDSLVAEHLKHSNYAYSASVFISEAGLSNAQLGMEDVLRVLHLQLAPPEPADPTCRSVLRYHASDIPLDVTARTPLLHVLTTLADLVSRMLHRAIDVQHRAVQADFLDGNTLEDKFRSVEQAIRGKAALSPLQQAQTLQDMMQRYQEEVDSQAAQLIKQEIERLKRAELAQIRLEEAAKYRRQLGEKMEEVKLQEAEVRHHLEMERLALEHKQHELGLRTQQFERERADLLAKIAANESFAKTCQQENSDLKDLCRRHEQQISLHKDTIASLTQQISLFQQKEVRRQEEQQQRLADEDRAMRLRETEMVEWRRQRQQQQEEWHHKLMQDQLFLDNERTRLQQEFQQREALLRQQVAERLQQHQQRTRAGSAVVDEEKLKEQVERAQRAEQQVSALRQALDRAQVQYGALQREAQRQVVERKALEERFAALKAYQSAPKSAGPSRIGTGSLTPQPTPSGTLRAVAVPKKQSQHGSKIVRRAPSSDHDVESSEPDLSAVIGDDSISPPLTPTTRRTDVSEKQKKQREDQELERERARRQREIDRERELERERERRDREKQKEKQEKERAQVRQELQRQKSEQLETDRVLKEEEERQKQLEQAQELEEREIQTRLEHERILEQERLREIQIALQREQAAELAKRECEEAMQREVSAIVSLEEDKRAALEQEHYRVTQELVHLWGEERVVALRVSARNAEVQLLQAVSALEDAEAANRAGLITEENTAICQLQIAFSDGVAETRRRLELFLRNAREIVADEEDHREVLSSSQDDAWTALEQKALNERSLAEDRTKNRLQREKEEDDERAYREWENKKKQIPEEEEDDMDVAPINRSGSDLSSDGGIAFRRDDSDD